MTPLHIVVVSVVGLFILGFSVLSANFILRDLYPVRVSDFYYNYSLGYLHRGIIGSIFQFFYGVPHEKIIQTIIPKFNYYYIRVLITTLWLLLIVPLVRLRLSSSLRWLLLACTALLLLAPIWRYENYYNNLDLYLFPCALLALICMLRRSAVLMVFPVIFGFLIHPFMLILCVLIYMLVLHACLTREEYATDWHSWLFSLVIVVVLVVVLNLANDPSRNLELLNQYNYSYPSVYEWLENDFLHTFEHNSNFILGIWRVHTATMLLKLFFLFIPLVLFILLARELDNEVAFENQPLQHRVAKVRLVRWMLNYDKQILVLAGMLCFVPTTIVVPDTNRMYLLGWWGLALVLVYILWSAKQQTVIGFTTAKSHRIRRTFLATCVGLLAYTFGGAPLVNFPDYSPTLRKCQQNCIPMLTDNSVGKFYSNAVFSLFYSQLFPLTIDARSTKLLRWKFRDAELVDDLLVLPAGSDGWFLYKNFSVFEGQQLRVSLEYLSEQVPNFELVVANSAVIQPDIRTPTRTVWTMEFESNSRTFIDVYLLQQEGLAFKEFRIEEVNQ